MKNVKTIIFIAIGFGFASCSPKYYVPNTQNVPLISQKGETNLTLSGNGNQYEFQGAYGVSSNFAIKANGGLFIPQNLTNGNGGSGKYVEIGGGYFKAIQDNWVFETYGIVGIGSMENHLPSNKDSVSKGDISASIFRIGIQPNFGYKSKYFSVALSSRIVNLSYSNIKGDLVFNNESQTAYLKNNSSNFLVEPAITIRGGLENLKLQMQFGYSINLTNSSFKQDNSFLTIGINYNIKQF